MGATMWVLAWLACGGDDKTVDDGTSEHSTATTEPDDNVRCLNRCERGSEGDACDAEAIRDACENYCVDPPPLPEECEDAFQRYETCVARVEDWTCVGSPAVIGNVVVPVPADPYECRLESDELEFCADIPDPGCLPTLGGVGAACTADMTLCNAQGVTFDANLLCDGVICSFLVDTGAGPVDNSLPRADLLCDELTEKAALGPDEAARFLTALTGLR